MTGDPPSTWDSVQDRVTDDRVTDVTNNSDGGAGGTPLFRLTEANRKTSLKSSKPFERASFYITALRCLHLLYYLFVCFIGHLPKGRNARILPPIWVW